MQKKNPRGKIGTTDRVFRRFRGKVSNILHGFPSRPVDIAKRRFWKTGSDKKNRKNLGSEKSEIENQDQEQEQD